MAKRSRSETEEERKERKRFKKESKKFKVEKSSTSALPSSSSSPERVTAGELLPSALTSSKDATIDGSQKSCLRKRVRMIFSLLPSDLEDVIQEIKRSLRQMLLRHVPGLDGVLLAFDNVSIVPMSGKTAGLILNEQPQIHYLADVDTLVFCPTERMRLKATVTECFESHVGLLVHHYFNASISSDCLMEAGYSFEDGSWVHEDGDTMATDEEINFTVGKVHECDGTISIEGVDPALRHATSGLSISRRQMMVVYEETRFMYSYFPTNCGLSTYSLR